MATRKRAFRSIKERGRLRGDKSTPRYKLIPVRWYEISAYCAALCALCSVGSLLKGLAYEVYKFIQAYPMVVNFIISVVANFFTSGVLAAKKRCRRQGGISNQSQFSSQEEFLRFQSTLVSIAKKMESESGIDSLESRGSVSDDRIEWEFVLRFR